MRTHKRTMPRISSKNWYGIQEREDRVFVDIRQAAGEYAGEW